MRFIYVLIYTYLLTKCLFIFLKQANQAYFAGGSVFLGVYEQCKTVMKNMTS